MARSINVLIFLCLLLVILASLKTPTFYDEGWAVSNAYRLNLGDIPYKDFLLVYPPAQFITISHILTVFGSNWLIFRLYDICIKWLLSIFIFLLARRFASNAVSYACAFASAFYLSSACGFLYAVFPACLLGLIAIFCITKPNPRLVQLNIVFSGLCTGITSLFRIDFAIYIFISVSIFFMVFRRLGYLSGYPVSKSFFLYTSSFVLISMPFYCYLVYICGFSNLFTQLIIFPFVEMQAYRRLPLPQIIPPLYDPKILLQWFRFYFPIVTYFTFFIHFFKNINKLSVKLMTAFTSSIFGALLFVQAINRYDLLHVVPTSIISWITVSALINNPTNRTLRKTVLLLSFVFSYIFLIARPVYNIIDFVIKSPPWKYYSTIDVTGGIPIDSDRLQAARYIRQSTADNEYIFVCNSRNDKIFVSDPGFYFLAQRKCASFYHDIFPGITTTVEAQNRIIIEIDNLAVSHIIKVNIPIRDERNKSAESSNVHILDEYIDSHYNRLVKYSRYTIYKRHDSISQNR